MMRLLHHGGTEDTEKSRYSMDEHSVISVSLW
jgi:hypothetical protein